MPFFAFLVIYLALEGSALVFVAGLVGWLAALALIFVVSMGGAYLVRRQGAQALVRIQETLARQESPDAELLEGVFIFAAGLLLFLPGFLSDLAGIALLIPPLRKAAAPWLLMHLKSRVERGRYIKTYTVYDYEWRGPERGPGSSPGSNKDTAGPIRIIDVPSHQVSETRPDGRAGERPGEHPDTRPNGQSGADSEQSRSDKGGA